MRFPFYLCRFLALAWVTAGFLRADTFEVTSFDDDGAGTLRAAIDLANANAGDDTITFAAGLDNEFIFLDTGTLVITDTTGKTTIDASSLPEGIFIDGFGFTRVRVFQIAAGADVEMRNIEITNGAAPNGADGASGAAPNPGDDGGDGGGIYNEGTLALYDCRITGNVAGNGGRGGDVSGNGAAFSGAGGNGGRGGGIFSTGDQASVSLFDCLVSGNDAGSGGDAGDGDIGTPSAGGNGGSGGGIYSDDRSKLRVVRTTISNNDAGQGGIGGQPGSGVVGGRGGDGGNGGGVGISIPVQMDDGNGTFFPLFEDCEISQNNTGGGIAGSATGGAGGDDSGSAGDIGGPGGNGGNGGGIWVELFATPDPGTVHLADCLIRDNNAGPGEEGGSRSSDDTTNGSDGGDGGSGAGIFVFSSLGSNQVWTMRNCTVIGNDCGPGGSGGTGGANGTGGGGGDAGNGGGLAFAAGGNDDYTAELVHLTVYNNTAGSSGTGGGADPGGTAGAAGSAGEGGGVWDGEIVLFDSGVVYQNTIVSLNTADSNADIKGGQRSGSTANLIGNSPNPLLDGLSDLGGPTQVLPPLVDSPAINGGAVLANPVTTDQRGFPRPQGGAPDIGAVEVGFQPDVKIGKKSNPATHRRNNYYSASAAGQNLNLKLAGRRKGKAFFSVESDGEIAETVTVRGTKPNRTLRLKVFRLTGGKANVTARLAAGLPLDDMEPGATVLFRIDVKARSKKRKPRQNLIYSARSEVVPAADAVKLKVRQQSGSFF